jgi:proline iminopeptidase
MKTSINFMAAILIAIVLPSCQKEDLNKPGNLVPKTVDEDPSLPSIAVNGTLLHAEAFGNPSNSMIVVLHGGPGSDYRNEMPAKQLVEAGYYVVFYDQRGCGLSMRHSKSSFSLQVMIDDLGGVIEHYRTSSSQKIFLFGHSWGAMLSAAYINQNPNTIAGAILIEPGGLTWDVMKDYVKRLRELNAFSETTNDVMYQDQFITGDENDHETLDYKKTLQWAYSYAPGNAEGIEGVFPIWRFGAVVEEALFTIADRDGFDFTTNLHQYTTKVVIMYSEKNRAYGVSTAQQNANFFPNAQIIRIDGTGHECIWFKWENVYPHTLSYFNSLN